MNNLKKIVIIGFVLFCLTGCKNFMNGGDLIKQIDDLIEYENSAYATVVVAADMDNIKEIQPANGTYSRDYKATDTVKVSATEKKEYVFLYWSIQPAASVQILDGGEITDKEIQFKILDSSEEIKVKPVCSKRPEVTITPEYRSDGVAKNTSIIVTFTNAMDIEPEDVPLIKIENAGVDYSEYYQAGQLSEDKTQITFVSNRNNLIPDFGGVKEVKVSIPESYGYKVKSNDMEFAVPFYSEQILYFRINNQTREKIKVTGKENILKGDLTQDGVDTLYFDDSISFSFVPKGEFRLNGWLVQDPSGRNISNECIERKITDDLSTITLTFRAVPSETEQIFVIPDVVDREKLLAACSSDHA